GVSRISKVSGKSLPLPASVRAGNESRSAAGSGGSCRHEPGSAVTVRLAIEFIHTRTRVSVRLAPAGSTRPTGTFRGLPSAERAGSGRANWKVSTASLVSAGGENDHDPGASGSRGGKALTSAD